MRLSFTAVAGFPMVEPGDDLAAQTQRALAGMGEALADGDVLVYAQKVVSKADGRYVDLRTVQPSKEAQRLAKQVDKDPRKVQAILDESQELVRQAKGVLITRHRLGFVQANAGIDQSNLPLGEGGDDLCLLLPEDPDASAERLRARLLEETGAQVAVIINDSLGRAWRLGTVGHAIGVAVLRALEDYIGSQDLFGRQLEVTQVAAADELAAGASLVMGQTTQKTPLVLVRGYQPEEPAEPGQRGVQPLLRAKAMDLFR